MSTHIAFSSPFTKVFSHLNHTLPTVGVPVQLRAAVLPSAANNKRVIIVVQNQSTTAIVNVLFNATDTDGIHLYPQQSISIENYNGIVRAFTNVAGSIVHTATAVV